MEWYCWFIIGILVAMLIINEYEKSREYKQIMEVLKDGSRREEAP
jgi:hypothetical protein